MSCVGRHSEEKESTGRQASAFLIRCYVTRTWKEVKGKRAPGRGNSKDGDSEAGACLESKEAAVACTRREVRLESSEGFEPWIALPASYQIQERTPAGCRYIWEVSLSRKETVLNVTNDLIPPSAFIPTCRPLVSGSTVM